MAWRVSCADVCPCACILQILYEEIEDYKAFVGGFKIDERTNEIAKVTQDPCFRPS